MSRLILLEPHCTPRSDSVPFPLQLSYCKGELRIAASPPRVASLEKTQLGLEYDLRSMSSLLRLSYQTKKNKIILLNSKMN